MPLTFTRRTNCFVLLLFINQFIWRMLWPYIVPALNIGPSGQSMLSQALLFLLPAAMYFILTKERPQKTLALRPLSLKNIVIITLLSFAVQPFMSILAALSSFFFPNNVSDALYMLQEQGLFMMLLAIAVTPAICEELFFRGIVFSGYKLQSLWRACVYTGLLFGLMHMDGQQFLYAFAMGTLFCFLRYRTGTIYAPILAHFIINATQVLLSWQASKVAYSYHENTVTVGILALLAGLTILLLSLPVLAGAFWWFLKANPEPLVSREGIWEYRPPADWKESILDLPFFLIILIYTADVIVFPLMAV